MEILFLVGMKISGNLHMQVHFKAIFSKWGRVSQFPLNFSYPHFSDKIKEITGMFLQ